MMICGIRTCAGLRDNHTQVCGGRLPGPTLKGRDSSRVERSLLQACWRSWPSTSYARSRLAPGSQRVRALSFFNMMAGIFRGCLVLVKSSQRTA
jgi:hypothetical protein